MRPIAEFDDAERWVVESALRERYGERVRTELADTELQPQPADLVTQG